MHAIDNPGRRTFLKAGAALGAGLTLGFYLSPGRAAQQAAAATATSFAPNAFLRIAPDNTVTVLVKHLEMGQGVYTGLPMLVAEELEVPWEQIRVESAPADAKLYGNLAWGGTAQGTGGSTRLNNSWDQLRQAGAAAREMLIAAAAALWTVESSALKVESGSVVHPQSQRRATYGELAAKAADAAVCQWAGWRLAHEGPGHVRQGAEGDDGQFAGGGTNFVANHFFRGVAILQLADGKIGAPQAVGAVQLNVTGGQTHFGQRSNTNSRPAGWVELLDHCLNIARGLLRRDVPPHGRGGHDFQLRVE